MGNQILEIENISIDTVWQVIDELAGAGDTLKSNWCVPPEAGRFLHTIARTQNAYRVVEVGTSIGFSTLHLALGVLENMVANKQKGLVTTIDASAERQAQANANFKKAGIDSLVDIQTGSALDILEKNASQWQGIIDLAFIDARKDEYLEYARLLYRALKPGGILIADNTRSHRKEMQSFVDYMLVEDRQKTGQWDSCELDTPNGLIISRKR